MSDPVFATKWDFLFATVLIGIDRTTGVFSGSEPVPGQQMVCVWTSDAVATEALHVESWELRAIAVRDLLRMLPAGIGIVVDPEQSSGMTASASYVANLKRFTAPFPADLAVRLDPWTGLPEPVRAALADVVSARDDVHELYAFAYTIDDSPLIGCLAHAGGKTVDAPAAVAAILTVLDAAGDPAALGVASVEVVALAGVPDEIRSAIGDAQAVHRPRRSRRWRR